MNERGQYGQTLTLFKQDPWIELRSPSFQRSLAVSALGSVAGAVLWKDHRIWGFILGGIAGGAIGDLVFTPR